MIKTLAMFPGQGSQYIGMGKVLLEEFPYTKSVFEEAEDAIRVDLRKLCFEGPDELLKLTENTQPAILTCSVASWAVLKEEAGFAPDYFAGHSLGEYSALVAGEKLALGQAVSLVKERGRQMQIAVPNGKGAMLAVLNYPSDSLSKDCLDVTNEIMKGTNPSDSQFDARSLDASLDIANYNSDKQLIVSGGRIAVELLQERLSKNSVKVVLLPVSAPFHSRLMQPARMALEPRLKALELVGSAQEVIANITGNVAQPYAVSNLIDQIDGSVLWAQTIETAVSKGCERFVEVGPGKVLFGLCRKAVPKGSKLIYSDDIVKAVVDLRAL